MAQPDFWQNQALAQKITQEVTRLKSKIEDYAFLQRKIEEIEVLFEFAQTDADFLAEAKSTLAEIESELTHLELQLLFQGEYDEHNVIFSLHAGAGGTESQDWTNLLLRMYTRWAEQKGFKLTMLNYLAGEEAGVKSVTLLIQGEYAYGLLKAEKGVHRLVRISPFDASGRRHTSFAAVDVLPEVDDLASEIILLPEEIKVDTYRASGAGGQHVNKTDSAVRMTHLPTGLVVQCQNERSQIANRHACEKILKAKLLEVQRREQEETLESLRGEMGEIAWGSQIRSYIFHPYSLVKDHRTAFEIGNVQQVMDGGIDPFIDAYLRRQAVEK